MICYLYRHTSVYVPVFQANWKLCEIRPAWLQVCQPLVHLWIPLKHRIVALANRYINLVPEWITWFVQKQMVYNHCQTSKMWALKKKRNILMLLFCIGFGFFSILTATYVLKINVPVLSQSVIACLNKRDACNKS